MPNLMKYNKNFVLLFSVILYFLFQANSCCAQDFMYYLKFNVVSINGEIISSDLQMIPVEDEYRAENFSWFQIEGVANISLPEGNPAIDAESLAKHDALKQLLTSYGLKSVSNKKITLNNVQKDETIMSYEGVVKGCSRILQKGYSKDRQKYYIKITINFSPIAFPDRWSFLYMKNKLYDSFNDVLSIFR